MYVVEDDIEIKKLLEEYINRYGFDVRGAKDFERIIMEFNEYNPDVVLLDINLLLYYFLLQ